MVLVVLESVLTAARADSAFNFGSALRAGGFRAARDPPTAKAGAFLFFLAAVRAGFCGVGARSQAPLSLTPEKRWKDSGGWADALTQDLTTIQ